MNKKSKIAAAASHAPAGLEAALDALFATLNRSDSPGLVVGVAQQGRTIYRKAFGLANVELGVANTVRTRMRIGSTSKHFTSVAVLLLAEEGKLDLDAPASAVFPELPGLQGMPTLRQFLNHTSGHRCYLDLAWTVAGTTVQPVGKALAAQLRQGGVNFAPGQGQLYNNGGYQLASLAVERASGLRFEDFLRQRLFEPLGLRDTESVPSDFSIIPGMATLYVPRPAASPGPRWRQGVMVTEELRGDGAIVSTVDDMLAWAAHLRRALAGEPTIGSAASWAQLTERTQLANGLVSDYGLGLWRHDYRGIEVIHHGGTVIGGRSQMLVAPAHELDIVIITNGAPAMPGTLAQQVLSAVLASQVHGPATPKMAGSKRYKHLLGARYAGSSGLLLGFEDFGGKLGLSLHGGPAMVGLREEREALRVNFEDLAAGPYVLEKSQLAAGADGEAPRSISVGESGNVERLQRLPVRLPSLAKVGTPLLGRYHCADADARAEITLEGGALMLRYQGGYGNLALKLSALSDTVFVARAEQETMPLCEALVVDRKGRRVQGFRIYTGRTRHLAFQRQAD